ncbi:hypothetical protein Tco_0515065, partial [Tanacetum coccineum]
MFSFGEKVMAAPVILISSDSSEESVGYHVSRVILFGTIPTIFVISPTRVLDLVDYSSSSDADPSEDSLPLTPELPLVSPFLCFDDSEADSESEPAEQRPKRHESLAVHDAMVSRWRDMVAYRPSLPSGSSSSDTFTPSSEFPVAPVVTPPGIHRRLAILRVGPFPARRLAWRRISHRSLDHHSSPDFTSDISSGLSSDSLSDSSSVHSS